MSDKFRRTIPLRITVADAERPTGEKLTAIAEQTRNGVALIERAIGDPWTQSGDSMMTSYPLQLPNLARMMGENKYLNPAIYPTTSTFRYTETLGHASSPWLNQNEGRLLFKPDMVYFNSADAELTTRVASEYLVNSTGKYWVDSETGRWRTYDAITASAALTYSVAPNSDWISRQETLPGVIPDPRQATFTSCRIESSGGKYRLHLPPRQPLTSMTARETPANYPPSYDHSVNQESSPGQANKKYWSYGTAALTGSGDVHYRYSLPKEVQDAWAGLAAGAQLPAGYLYLYDQTSGTVIEDVVFKKPTASPTDWVLEVESSSFAAELELRKTTGETEADFSGTNLTLITCGSPVTRTIWTLMAMFLRHEHGNADSLEPAIKHHDLVNANPPVSSYADHGGRYPTHLLEWQTSNWAHDDHTYLLSRAGSQGGTDERDALDNAMLGHLLLANANTSNYLDVACTDGSYRLYFGDVGGPSVHADSASIELQVSGVSVCTLDGTNKRIGFNQGTPDRLIHAVAADGVDAGIRLQPGALSADTAYVRFERDDENVFSVVGNVSTVDDNPEGGVFTGTLVNSTLLGTYGAQALHLGTNANVRMTILSDGKVGIGRNAPTADLEVFKSAGPIIRLVDNNDPSSYVQIQNVDGFDMKLTAYANTGEADIWLNPLINDGTSPAYIRLFRDTNTTGSKRLVFYEGNGSGNIVGEWNYSAGVGGQLSIGGIQSGNRSAALALAGSNAWAGTDFEIARSSAGANASTTIRHRGTGGLTIKTQEASAIYFQTTNTTRFSVAATGKTTFESLAAYAPINLEPLAEPEPTSPAKGDLSVSTRGKLSVYNGSNWDKAVVQSHCDTGTPRQAIEDVDTLQYFTGYTIPANTLKAGSTIRISCGIYIRNYNSGTIDYRIKCGNDTICYRSHTPAADDVYTAEAVYTIRETGASADLSAIGWSGLTGESPVMTHDYADPFSASVDTTSGIEVTAGVTWSVANGNNTAELIHFAVDVL